MYVFQINTDNLPYEKVGKNEPVCIADEVPFDIPDSWEWVRLSTVNDIYTGNSINESEKKLKYTGLKDGYYYIGTKDVGFDHIIDYDNGVKIPYGLERFRIAPRSSILMCVEGGSAGRKISFTNQDVCFGNKLCCFVSLGIEHLFLYYYLQSPLFQSIFKENTTGIIGGVSVNTLKSLLFPIPPLEEQKRIVNKLKELESYLKAYADTEQAITNLNQSFPEQLKKSILQEAVQGKLVSQDPTDEPASVLLERIRAEKEQLIKAGKIKRDKHESVIFRRDNSHYEKRGSEEVCIDEELPFDIPSSWEWCRIGSLFQVNPRNDISDDTDVGFIPMALIKDGFRNEHTFEERKWKNIKSGFTHFADGDIVVAKITPCFQNRKSAIISQLPSGIGAGTTELHVIRDVTSMLFMPYFLLICKTNDFIENGVKNFSGTAGQQRIGKDYISDYLVPIPPINEQVRIVDTVMKAFSNIDDLYD